MNNHNIRSKSFRNTAALLLLMTGGISQTSAQTLWTGASGTDTNWSTGNNWSTLIAPGAGDSVVFDNTSAVTSPSTPNNVVDGSLTIATLQFTNAAINTAPNYHVTRIQSGQTLTISSGLTVGPGPSSGNNQVVNAIFTGTGAALNLVGGDFAVGTSSGSDGPKLATLDMSGLDTFTATVGRFNIGVQGAPPGFGSNNKSRGLVYLARTNVITVNSTGATNAFLVGWNQGSGTPEAAVIYLGQTNRIFADAVTVGTHKQNGCLMAFNPVGLSNPGAFFRNNDGSSRVSFWQIGDESLMPSSNQNTSGTNDFSGGLVDALVDNMRIGASCNGNNTGSGSGTLTFDKGVIDANNVQVGYQTFNANTGSGTGVVNVNGAALLRVNNTLELAHLTSAAAAATGTLNINGGTVQAESMTVGGGVVSVHVNGGTLVISNNAFGTDLAGVSQFNITNSTLTLPAVLGDASVTTTNFAMGGATNVIHIGSLPVIAGYPVTFPIIKYSSLSGTFNVGLGSLPPASPSFQGYLTNNTATMTVELVLTGGPADVRSLTWVGQVGNGNWDQDNTANWKTNGGPLTTFHDLDFVRFDDTAVNSAVSLNGFPLLPSVVVVSNQTTDYVFDGFGYLSGNMALTKQGGAKLILANSGQGGDNNNDFTGGVEIEAGAIQVGNGDSQGSLGAGDVVNNGSLIFARTDTHTVNNIITGGGSISSITNGTLVLGGANTFDGAVTVSAGTLRVNNNSALGSTNGGTVINSGATLDFNSTLAQNVVNLGLEQVTVSGAGTDGNGAILNSGSFAQINALRLLTLAGDTVLGGPGMWLAGVGNSPGRWDIRGTGAELSTGGQPYSLIKTGQNQITIVGAVIDPALGDMDIKQGLLQFQGNVTSMGNPSSNLFIRAGATLGFNGTTNLWDKQFQLFGDGSSLTLYQSDGSATIIGPMTLNGDCRVSVADGADSLILSNSINGSGSLTLTEPGTNPLILAGPTKTYSGGTKVSSGKLVVNSILSGSGLTNDFGTFLAGHGTNTGPVEVNGTLLPGDAGVAGTFGAGNLTLNGPVTFDLGTNNTPGGGINDLVTVSGNLTFGGSSLTINPLGRLQNGSYRLFSYTGTRTGMLFDPPAVGRYAFSVVHDDVNKHVNLGVSGGPVNLRWISMSDSTWDTLGTPNWTTNIAGTTPAEVFYEADAVLFDDTAGVQTSISISSPVLPVTVTNNSSANHFTFSGTGGISGSANVVKLGGSTLTVQNTNSFTGDMTILGGTVIVNSALAIGAVTSTTYITNGGTLDVSGNLVNNGQNFGAKPFVVSGAGVGGNGAIVNNGSVSQQNAFQNVTLAGDVVFGGSARWDIRGSASVLNTGGNPWNITKKGANQINFTGTAVDTNLANIDIQAGMFGMEGALTSLGNPTNTLTIRGGATLRFTSLVNVLDKLTILEDGATFHNTGGSNTFAGIMELNGTVTNNMAGTTLVLTNTIRGSGSLVKIGSAALRLSGSNTYSGATIINAGSIMLIGSGSISSSSNIVLNATGASLNVTGRDDLTLTLASGRTLSGIGTVTGNLISGAGSTVSPGTNSIGRLNVSSGATLQGTTFIEINKSLSATNDQVFATGDIAYGGTLLITNLGPAYAAGDSFKLFNGANYSGAFAIQPATPGAGLAWDASNLTVDGTLKVVSTAAPQPTIGSITISGGNLILTGTNNAGAGGTFQVLTSTNVVLPLNNWAVLTNGTFDGNGNFNITNAAPTDPLRFYLLQVP